MSSLRDYLVLPFKTNTEGRKHNGAADFPGAVRRGVDVDVEAPGKELRDRVNEEDEAEA